MLSYPTLKDLKEDLFNQVNKLKQPAVLGVSATIAAVALPAVASYFGCNVSNEWYTVGASGALGSLAAARYNQHGLPDVNCNLCKSECCNKSSN
jgi:hypothetical protein